MEYLGVKEVNGSLIILEGVKDASYEEMVDIKLDDGTTKVGRVIEIQDDIAIVQVFEGTSGISRTNTRTSLRGTPLMLPLSMEILGRTMDGRFTD
jgi:V/A-type H+-transporting ATPase subunit B